METINYLLGYEDLKIIQEEDKFCFSLDSVLLPNFVTINKSCSKILDIGCGNAPIPLILTKKTTAKITGIEIQKNIYDLAVKTVKLNNLEDQISIINDDVNNYYISEETDIYDVITCNPPYFKVCENSNFNNSDYKTLARHEKTLTLDQIFKISKKLLKNNGVVAIVNRPERFVEIIESMKSNNIEPKRVQFVYPKKDKEANILLIEGTKNGKPGLKILPPLYAHNESGEYTDEIKKYFS